MRRDDAGFQEPITSRRIPLVNRAGRGGDS